MLSVIRDQAKSWIAAAIVGLLSVSFALWGIQYYTSRQSTQSIVAEVNGIKITHSELNWAYEQLRNQWLAKVGAGHPLTAAAQHVLRTAALEGLVDRLVITQQVNTLRLRIDPFFVNQTIRSIPAFQDSAGKFSLARFQVLLARMGLSPEQFLGDLEHDLLIHQWREGILSSAFVLPNEWDQINKAQLQRRSIRYLRISVPKLAQSIVVPEDKAREYYNHHQETFKTPEKVQVAYVHLSADLLASKLTITEEALKTFYQNNLDLYTPSNNPSPTPPTQQQPTKAITGSADTLTASLSPKPLPFNIVREKVKQAFIAQEIEKRFSEAAEELANLSYTHPDQLKSVSETLGLPIQTTAWLTQQTTQYEPAMVRAAFSDSVLQEGNNSSAIQLKDGSLVVLRVSKHQPSVTPPFEAIRDSVDQAFRYHQAQEQAQQLSETLVKALHENQLEQVNRLMKQYGWVWQEAKSLAPQALTPSAWWFEQKSISPSPFLLDEKKSSNGFQATDVASHLDQALLVNLAFSLPKPTPSQPSVCSHALANKDHLVVQLLDIRSTSQAASSTETKANKQLKNNWIQSTGQLEYQQYRAALKSQASVHIYSK